jgi:hypothetical protein
MALTITALEAQTGGSTQEKTINIDLIRSTNNGTNEQSAYVSSEVYGDKYSKTYVFTLAALPVTLVKNGTTSGGGGTKIWTMPAGLVLPVGGSSNLTIAAAGDKSFLASVGSAAAGTDGTLTSTEISFLPQTAATTSSGAGTCKMKSTSTTPTPGAPVDALTFSGTITLRVDLLGDN